MKTKTYIFILLALALCSCKQKEWIEWKTQNEIWLQLNKQKEGVQTTPSGLQYKILYEGNPTTTKPSAISTVYVSYSGSMINGIVFDSQSSAALSLQSTVKGFAEGMTKIYRSGDIELYIPWDLGYGVDGSGTEGYSGFIPPYSTLIFRIHLNDITN